MYVCRRHHHIARPGCISRTYRGRRVCTQGFYPGYYLFFIASAFLTEASKGTSHAVLCEVVVVASLSLHTHSLSLSLRSSFRPAEVRRKIRPLVMKDEATPLYPQKYVYDVLGTVATSLTMNYIGLSFVVRLRPALSARVCVCCSPNTHRTSRFWSGRRSTTSGSRPTSSDTSCCSPPGSSSPTSSPPDPGPRRPRRSRELFVVCFASPKRKS